MEQKMTYTEMLERLMSRELNKSVEFKAQVLYFEDNLPESFSLTKVLSVENSELTGFGRLLVDFLDRETESSKRSYLDLVWRVMAWLEFQDLMDLELEVKDSMNMLNYHYCYFEATRTLIESLHAGINGYFHAAVALLRPFIELAVLEVYFRKRKEIDTSYKSFRRWFSGKKGQFQFKNTVDQIFSPEDKKRFSAVRQRILGAYRGTSKYVHKPRFDESFVYIRKTNTVEPSLEAIYYWIIFTSIVLQSVLWLYVLKYPMSLFPVDIVQKFAYNWPVGVFSDRCNALILERALGKEDFDAFKKDLGDNARVKGLLNWYDEFPDKTHNKIETSWLNSAKTWTKEAGNITRKAERIALAKAHLRANLWALSYPPVENQRLEIPIDDSVLEYSKTKHLFS